MARKRNAKGPWFWRGTIVLMLASVFGLFAVAAFNAPPPLNADNRCKADRKDPAHTVLLIDQSDPFTPNDINWVRALVDEEARTLRKYGRLTVMVPNAADPYNPSVIFAQCSPGSADQANPLLANPRMIEDTWRETFYQPLIGEIERALASKEQPASPLSEALYAISDRADFQSGNKDMRLVLVSDLMQHSEDFSFYRKGADLSAFNETRLSETRPNLAGVDVVARIVPRQEYDLPMGDVKAFWRTYFEQTGANYGSIN
ncbi:MAG: hypothetical protein AAF253_13415 [Pseudomonadota bacterium]